MKEPLGLPGQSFDVCRFLVPMVSWLFQLGFLTVSQILEDSTHHHYGQFFNMTSWLPIMPDAQATLCDPEDQDFDPEAAPTRAYAASMGMAPVPAHHFKKTLKNVWTNVLRSRMHLAVSHQKQSFVFSSGVWKMLMMSPITRSSTHWPGLS